MLMSAAVEGCCNTDSFETEGLTCGRFDSRADLINAVVTSSFIPATRLGLEGIGISPDLNPEFTATPRELFSWALEPAEDHILDMFFELGHLDAAAWAAMNLVEKVVEDDLVGNGVSNS